MEFARRNPAHKTVELIGKEDRVGNLPVHLAHIDRFVQGRSLTLALAGMLADAASGGRQRIIQNHGFECFFEAVFLVKLKEPRNIHVQRTTVLARRQIMANFLIDSCQLIYGSHFNLPCRASLKTAYTARPSVDIPGTDEPGRG
jgi:hypothetical protein